MIYFKVDVGYYEYSKIGSSGLKNLSEITITDTDTYYGIGTIFNAPFPYGDKTIAEFQSYGTATFGDDFYKIWLVPGANDGNQLSVVKYGWIPWAGEMYPNLYELFKDNGTSGSYKAGAIIFKTLNKVAALDGSTTPNISLYTINKDNSLTLISSSLDNANVTSQGMTFSSITNYTPGMNLSKATFYTLYAVVNTTSKRDSNGFNGNEFLSRLLATNPKPDKEDPDPQNPYGPGGEIKPGGGEGDFDNTSDPIDFPPIPTLSAVDTGFLTLFNPSLAQLQELSQYMWSDLFNIEGWKKIFADPMDAILGLTIVPVAVPEAGTGVVSVGNISTGISMTKAAGQYVEVDCGTLNVNEYWGAYLDYDPYTKAEIYLPFIGIHALSTDDIMNKPVHVKYHIDLLSGACCAYVKCGDSVLYSFVGQCSCAIPTTSSDWTNIINGALSIAGSIGTMVATGGASAPMVAGTIASAAVNSLKPNIEKSGSMGGMGGMLGVQQPYIILTRPRQALPPKLSSYTGYPSFMTKVLGDLSGYTIVDSIHLENIPATGAELSEIEALLKGGVIL